MATSPGPSIKTHIGIMGEQSVTEDDDDDDADWWTNFVIENLDAVKVQEIREQGLVDAECQ